MTTQRIGALILAALVCGTAVHAEEEAQTGTQAAARTNAQNYRDLVLATCIATAYHMDTVSALDAGSSVSALRDWTHYDMDMSPDAIKALVERYLVRDYRNPLAEAEVKGVRFDLLKCLDLYHSKDLDAQVKQFVFKPNRTYRQEGAAASRQ